MPTEFNTITLQEWKNEHIRFLVIEEVTSIQEAGGLAAFMIHPFKSVELLESFMLHKNRGIPFEQQQDIIAYDIANPEVNELADGIPYCRYYFIPQNFRPAA